MAIIIATMIMITISAAKKSTPRKKASPVLPVGERARRQVLKAAKLWALPGVGRFDCKFAAILEVLLISRTQWRTTRGYRIDFCFSTLDYLRRQTGVF